LPWHREEGVAKPVKPFSWAFPLLAQSLELATRAQDHVGIDPIERQMQLHPLKVTVSSG
jgi:hypothetical protein